MTNGLPHDNITPFDDPGRSKKEQMAEMFDRIARRYDVTNRVLSAGIDINWRKKAILQLKKRQAEADFGRCHWYLRHGYSFL